MQPLVQHVTHALGHRQGGRVDEVEVGQPLEQVGVLQHEERVAAGHLGDPFVERGSCGTDRVAEQGADRGGVEAVER